MVNSYKLKGKIVSEGFTQKDFAEKIGISASSLSQKLSGKRDFTIGEVDRICSVLCIVDAGQKVEIFLH